MSQRFADRPVLRIAWIVATWFGCGMVPKAPGTMGSLGAIPLYLLVARGDASASAEGPWS